jgi:DDE superfamily endonuclease
VDARPSIQARARLHRAPPAARGRVVRYEHEYEREGALTLPAAMGARTGEVFATTPEAVGIAPFTTLIGQVMERPEYRDAPRALIIAGNGPGHRGKKAADRLRKAHPDAIMIHTPTRASWLSQAGIFLSAVQKKATGSGGLPSLEAPPETLLAFVERHDRTARPFGWHYTAADLKDLLRRITEHEKQDAARQDELALAA